MTVLEVGLIHAGIPLVYKSYDEKGMIDPVMRSGFLTALNTFATEAFSDEIESFSMKNYQILMIQTKLLTKNSPVIVYCIGDKKINQKLVKSCLQQVINAFIDKYNFINEACIDTSQYEQFKEVFDEKMGDLLKKTEDRLRTVF